VHVIISHIALFLVEKIAPWQMKYNSGTLAMDLTLFSTSRRRKLWGGGEK
jgi:hypothetical protein